MCIRDSLNVVPAKGNITVDLVLSESSADMLETLTACYEDLVARQLTTEDIISLLLFDYVAERKTARILGTLGLRRLGSRQRGGGNTSSSH